MKTNSGMFVNGLSQFRHHKCLICSVIRVALCWRLSPEPGNRTNGTARLLPGCWPSAHSWLSRRQASGKPQRRDAVQPCLPNYTVNWSEEIWSWCPLTNPSLLLEQEHHNISYVHIKQLVSPQNPSVASELSYSLTLSPLPLFLFSLLALSLLPFFSFFGPTCGHSLVAQQVKDPSLSLLWLGSLLWCEFYPLPGNFHLLPSYQGTPHSSLPFILPYLFPLSLPSAFAPPSFRFSIFSFLCLCNVLCWASFPCGPSRFYYFNEECWYSLGILRVEWLQEDPLLCVNRDSSSNTYCVMIWKWIIFSKVVQDQIRLDFSDFLRAIRTCRVKKKKISSSPRSEQFDLWS